MSAPDDLGALRRSRTRARLVRWAWWAAGAVALLALAAAAWFSPVLAVTSVTVEGGDIVDTGAVRADAEEQVLGVPLPQVRRERLGGELEAQYPAAQSIEVDYAGLRSLRVRVTDRTPVIAIVDDGTATRFDGGGVRIDEVPADGLELPVLQADEGVDAPAAARDGAALITALDGEITAPVEELRATRSGEFELRVRTEDGDARILLGSAEDGERKARIAAVLLDEGHQTIDVSVPDVPVAR